jgi:hypothetical protein
LELSRLFLLLEILFACFGWGCILSIRAGRCILLFGLLPLLFLLRLGRSHPAIIALGVLVPIELLAAAIPGIPHAVIREQILLEDLVEGAEIPLGLVLFIEHVGVLRLEVVALLHPVEVVVIVLIFVLVVEVLRVLLQDPDQLVVVPRGQ